MFTGDASRRAFLKRSAALGMAGGAAPFVVNLAAIGEAAAAVGSDYKALVCVFLYGGNDYANTLPPYDQASYDDYARLRSTIALPRAALDATLLRPAAALDGGRQYALAPTLAPLLPLFDAGKMAAVLNVGTLVGPTTKAQYLAKSASVPPKLFSHNDQQSFWQSSHVEGAPSGWGGRMGDLFESGNGTAALTCINATSNAVFLTGRTVIQYATGTNGPTPLLGNASALAGSSTAMAALKSLMTAPRSQILENEYDRISKRALDTYAQVSGALSSTPPLTTVFPATILGNQLSIVARMISAASALGAKKQVFFVGLAGFDTHNSLPTAHPALLAQLAGALNAFYSATLEIGAADKVTAFTASDFGRTLVSNADGSDHGWGGMHFVLGGAVKGSQIYGTPPVLADNGPDDVGQGRLLPSISVDQYAATLASWFGVAPGDMTTVLPNLGNFNPSSWNVGFI